MQPDYKMVAEKGADRSCLHLAIVGPTATGKSALALDIAEGFDRAALFSMDAFQVYRGLDIGTGKTPPAERKGIPHFLLDRVEPDQAYSVADYLRDAESALAEVQKKSNSMAVHFWVGGTGLYFRALREGLNAIPATDPEVRRDLESEPAEKRAREIRAVDPRWAEVSDLQNPRRVIRALAVYRQTGRPLSEWQRQPSQALLNFDHVFYLECPINLLKERIVRRVREMWDLGWPEEVRHLMEQEGWLESPSARAIGYRELASFLLGKCSQEECLDEISLRTWQYAKRQRTWFRKERGLITVEASNSKKALERIRSSL
jgi:tRNA dimethylallyltransferase